jgi:exodeoxyribonuclease V alpha subunit
VWFVELGRLVTYARSEATQLAPAYALTVHKTQGSEFPHVIVVCHSTHSHMLSRSLLYTAVTRASVKVTLIGDDVGLARALKSDAARRETTLVERIRNTLEAVELAP